MNFNFDFFLFALFRKILFFSVVLNLDDAFL
jgi:hypothetical protein